MDLRLQGQELARHHDGLGHVDLTARRGVVRDGLGHVDVRRDGDDGGVIAGAGHEVEAGLARGQGDDPVRDGRQRGAGDVHLPGQGVLGVSVHLAGQGDRDPLDRVDGVAGRDDRRHQGRRDLKIEGVVHLVAVGVGARLGRGGCLWRRVAALGHDGAQAVEREGQPGPVALVIAQVQARLGQVVAVPVGVEAVQDPVAGQEGRDVGGPGSEQVVEPGLGDHVAVGAGRHDARAAVARDQERHREGARVDGHGRRLARDLERAHPDGAQAPHEVGVQREILDVVHAVVRDDLLLDGVRELRDRLDRDLGERVGQRRGGGHDPCALVQARGLDDARLDREVRVARRVDREVIRLDHQHARDLVHGQHRRRGPLARLLLQHEGLELAGVGRQLLAVGQVDLDRLLEGRARGAEHQRLGAGRGLDARERHGVVERADLHRRLAAQRAVGDDDAGARARLVGPDGLHAAAARAHVGLGHGRHALDLQGPGLGGRALADERLDHHGVIPAVPLARRPGDEPVVCQLHPRRRRGQVQAGLAGLGQAHPVLVGLTHQGQARRRRHDRQRRLDRRDLVWR